MINKDCYFFVIVKYLWEKIPDSYPEDIPFIDPNNGTRIGNTMTRKKPRRSDLEKMFVYLKDMFIRMVCEMIFVLFN